ncbi:caspase-8 [Toxorhynchites rutilus septentrionalis]|uniref:caspase-8 n=1 Tax=Toxorhynchites rutilus septentrionalis TaxID=329112 RepID=UPI002479D0B8|nr:caspase-8 [Toxorhynchites rutilus septentrionalis]
MSTVISEEDLGFIESELPFEDKVSLLFLLYGQRDPKYLQQTLAVASRVPEEDTQFLIDWVNYMKTDWQSELLEALVIVQANLCLIKCGHDADELRDRYLPHVPELATFVHPILKGLYLLCERMEESVGEKLVKYLVHKYCIINNGGEYFEIVILDLITRDLIKLGSKSTGEECDLLTLIASFKELDLYALSDYCKSIANHFNKDIIGKQNQADNAKDSINFRQIPSDSKQPDKSVKISQLESYYITKANAGIVLIINQFKFYRETNPELTELLPLKPLNDRRGTEVDKDAIINLFTELGYRLILKENIPHLEILKQVENAVSQIESAHCSLVVCLLSHGQEGMVYGSNSIPVSVKAVERTMASEKLTGKPKLLFVQACQGLDLQAAVEIPRLEHDGPSSERTASIFVDFLVAWSTVPGFASVRHIEKGSWFIQELCQKLKQLRQGNHIMDILTAVINDVSSKRGYGNECMVPIIYSTLRKRLYFGTEDVS